MIFWLNIQRQSETLFAYKLQVSDYFFIIFLFFLNATRKEEKNSKLTLDTLLILLCPFPAYNHYAKNINKPVWDNEGLLTQQMTGFQIFSAHQNRQHGYEGGVNKLKFA